MHRNLPQKQKDVQQAICKKGALDQTKITTKASCSHSLFLSVVSARFLRTDLQNTHDFGGVSSLRGCGKLWKSLYENFGLLELQQDARRERSTSSMVAAGF
eukprot:5826550-Amphidinium_carterae.1